MRWYVSTIPLAFSLAMFFQHAVAGELTRYTDSTQKTEAVRVKRGGLAHTGMMLGEDTGTGDFGLAHLVEQISRLATARHATLADVVKLNVYVAPELSQSITRVEDGIRKQWPNQSSPAVTIIPTPILDTGAQIAADAVIAVDSDLTQVERIGSQAAIMPPGRDILYLSGRAAAGALPEATAETMRELFEVLGHLGSGPAEVVQVKAFMQPMAEWKSVAREIDRSFGTLGSPPVIFVAWTSPSRATEIELIAAAPERAETAATVSYFTPPGDKSSPVYSRVARVHADELIYTSGLAGTSASSPESEVRSTFTELQRILQHAGSDLRHLVKATYYVSKEEPSAALNRLRPDYFDPERPPAASKVAVIDIGRADRGLLIDMIAVPTAK